MATPRQGFEFTERLRTVLSLANDEARHLKHEYIGTEHLLLGLLREGEGVAIAALKELNVNLDDVKAHLHDTVIAGKNESIAERELPFTSRAQKVMELTRQEAREQNQTVVGTHHLLLGLLREGQGIASQVLTHAGAKEESVRAEMQRVLGLLPSKSQEHFAAVSPISERNSDTAWSNELDALTASPQQHWLLLENDRVRVLDTLIEPGERTPVHSHRWPAAHYVLSWSHFVRRDPEGKIILDTRTIPELQSPPSALWGEPLPPHSLENVGDTPLHIISVEVKAQP